MGGGKAGAGRTGPVVGGEDTEMGRGGFAKTETASQAVTGSQSTRPWGLCSVD